MLQLAVDCRRRGGFGGGVGGGGKYRNGDGVTLDPVPLCPSDVDAADDGPTTNVRRLLLRTLSSSPALLHDCMDPMRPPFV